MGKIACPCGNTMHDDTTVSALLFRVDPHTKDLSNELFQRVYRKAVDCWEGKRMPDPFAHDLVHMFEGESTRVHQCEECGRICWDVLVDKENEKYELAWFKPEKSPVPA